MNKILLTSLILVFASTLCIGQVKTYYKTTSSNRVYTKSKYEDYKKTILNKVKEQHQNVTLNEKLVDSLVSQDSIIKTYKLEFKSAASFTKRNERPNEKIYSYLNKELPNFNLQTIDGKNISFSDLKNKPTIINFWFTRCKPCVEEIPILNKLAKKYGDKVNFISITPDNKETIAEFLKTHQFHYKHLVNARSYTNEVGIYGYPKNIFISKDGIIKYIKRGIPHHSKNGIRSLGSGDEFERYIKELL